MKKRSLFKTGITMLIIMLMSLVSCTLFQEVSYKLDTKEFNTVVAYSEEVDLSGLNIVKTVGEEETVIKVEQSMVTSCDSTLSTGSKSMTISHEGQEFKVGFTVKYRVEFKSGDDIISTQYVLASNQINLPDDPIKSGFEFDGWSPKVPISSPGSQYQWMLL